MMKRGLTAISILFVAVWGATAQIAVTGPGSPTVQVTSAPLNIPSAGMIEVLPLVPSASFYDDSVRITDCPATNTEPFGLCSNLLFGGHALFSTHLTGYVQIQFYPIAGGVSHFEISFPQNLVGNDTTIAAPQLYSMPVTQNYISNPLATLSSGDVDVATGNIVDQNVSVLVSNSWYLALAAVNPLLIPEPFSFPGPIGYSQIVFANRTDGMIDFTFAGSTFNPLGAYIQSDPVRVPFPLCGPLADCVGIQARGTSLHPTMELTTVAVTNPPCAPNCPALPANTDMDFTSNNYYTTFGDNFGLNVPQLGGTGPGRSQLTGRVNMQFGPPNGNFVPFHLTAIPPEGLLGPAVAGLPLGVQVGLIGSYEFVYFPLATYYVANVLIADDPFNQSIGEIDLTTGVALGNYIHRSYFSQSLFVALASLNPGIVPASLAFQGPLQFETDGNGEIVLRFNGAAGVNFSGLVFPESPTSLGTGYITGPGSQLDVFYRMQMMHSVDTPATSSIMTGSATGVVDSLLDTISYSYSIPCSPVGQSSSFTYSNNNVSGKGVSSGTFTMNSLSSVQCTNTRTSTMKSGTYDTVTFSGYGSWSNDTSQHIVNAQFDLNPPYVHIMIDAGQTSQGNTKPAVTPLP